MSEVLVRFTQEIIGTDGRSYTAQACGSPARDRANAWIGWVEFLSYLGAARTGRETTQPNHDALIYWAQGLTQAYLQGALNRALGPGVPDLAPRIVELEPAFDCPRDDLPARGPARPHAILDPFAVFQEGEHILRQQLLALSPDHLTNLIEGYGLTDAASAAPGDKTARVEAIVSAVRSQMPRAATQRNVGPNTRATAGP